MVKLTTTVRYQITIERSIMQIREQLELVVNDALKDALAKGALELEEAPSAALERPRD